LVSPPGLSVSTVAIITVYLLLTVAVGYVVQRRTRTSKQFLHGGRSLPAWVTSIAFLAANCGALEIVGLVAASAKYGALALHFYWIGAIPAMVFLALFMMPIYASGRALTVPEFLRLRYGPRVQVLNVVSLVMMMGLISGISLYAIAAVLRVFLGWGFLETIALTSIVVFCYVSMGGLRATIYNEVLQLTITIVGLVPLSYRVLREFHGLRGLAGQLPENMRHVWSTMPVAASQQAPMDVIGVVFGLGFVLSFGYWCTDFLLIQRALAARSIKGSIHTPLVAAGVKMFFPLLVVVPGIAASLLFAGRTGSYDRALPLLMLHYYGPGLLGVGVAAILASLMSALAGNITALSTIWTHDLYRTYLQSGREDAHYVRVGRFAMMGATCFSLVAAYIAVRYNSLMDYLQLVFSLFNAPLFATLLLGMFTRWATPTAAFWGLLCGMVISIGHNFAYRFDWLHYGSQMGANFYGAIYGWSVCFVVTAAMSAFTRGKPVEELEGITFSVTGKMWREISPLTIAWGVGLLVVCVVLNVLFR
jgi:solute:Na+ symporter, SSS family